MIISNKNANLATKLLDCKNSLVPCNDKLLEVPAELPELPDKPNELISYNIII